MAAVLLLDAAVEVIWVNCLRLNKTRVNRRALVFQNNGRPAGALAFLVGTGERGQKQRGKNADNRDDDQQFNQREAMVVFSHPTHLGTNFSGKLCMTKLFLTKNPVFADPVRAWFTMKVEWRHGLNFLFRPWGEHPIDFGIQKPKTCVREIFL